MSRYERDGFDRSMISFDHLPVAVCLHYSTHVACMTAVLLCVLELTRAFIHATAIRCFALLRDEADIDSCRSFVRSSALQATRERE